MEGLLCDELEFSGYIKIELLITEGGFRYVWLVFQRESFEKEGMMVWKKGKQELVSLLPSVTKYTH